METVLDLIIVLFWGTFFLATLLGVVNEYRKNHKRQQQIIGDERLEDDDPVYLMGPYIND